ncbi:hypothetical protein M0R04_10010 [Candidatus Dojkabacteria bacterium]|nr:hypothetical protein [Candidatus Dojkabacteria bacterium]
MKLIEDELSTLSFEIISDMSAENKDKLALADGTGVFTLSKRKTWTYSPVVKAMDESLKKQKSEEQASGMAEYTEKDTLIFTVPKSEE